MIGGDASSSCCQRKRGKYFRVILVFKLVSSVFSCSSVLSVNFFKKVFSVGQFFFTLLKVKVIRERVERKGKRTAIVPQVFPWEMSFPSKITKIFPWESG
jgi:hypothetical protein